MKMAILILSVLVVILAIVVVVQSVNEQPPDGVSGVVEDTVVTLPVEWVSAGDGVEACVTEIRKSSEREVWSVKVKGTDTNFVSKGVALLEILDEKGEVQVHYMMPSPRVAPGGEGTVTFVTPPLPEGTWKVSMETQ